MWRGNLARIRDGLVNIHLSTDAAGHYARDGCRAVRHTFVSGMRGQNRHRRKEAIETNTLSTRHIEIFDVSESDFNRCVGIHISACAPRKAAIPEHFIVVV
jgi:hypothetical protein